MSFRPEFHSLAVVGILVGLVGCQGAHPESTAPETIGAPGGLPAAVPDATQDASARAEDPPSLADLQILALEDPGAALNQMDRMLAEKTGEGPLLLLFADTTLAFFQHKLENGNLGPGLASDLLQDALGAYEGALRAGMAPRPALLGLIRCHRQLGDPASSWDAALALYDQIAPQIEAGQKVAEETLLAIGRAGLEQTISAVEAGGSAPGSSHVAVLALRTAKDQGSTAAILPLADLHAWLGSTESVAEVLGDGLHQAPHDLELYGRLQSLGRSDRNLQVGLLEQLRLDIPGQPTPLWYLG